MSILKSKKKTTAKKLIIGDSTAYQFFDNRRDNNCFYSLSCNQAIGLCGQFFLLNNYLNVGNRPEEVYVLYYPEAFNNNLDQIFTYHYFLKPFYRNEYKPLMTENVMHQIKQIPYYRFSQFSLIMSSAWAPDFSSKRKLDGFLSPISIEYLAKIDSLQVAYGFKLYYVPTFVAKSNEKQIQTYNLDRITDNRTRNVLQFYLNNIHYLSDSVFSDGVHLQQPLEYKKDILGIMKKVKSEVDSTADF